MKKKKESQEKAEQMSAGTRRLWPFILGGTLLGVVALGAGAYQLTRMPESFYVHRSGIESFNFSNLDSFAEAQKTVHAWTESKLSSPIEFQSSQGNVSLTLAALGLEVPLDKFDEALAQFSEEASPLQKLKVALLGQNFPIEALFNEEAFNTALIATGLEQEQQSSSFAWVEGSLVITPEQYGTRIDRENLSAWVQANWKEAELATVAPLTIHEDVPEWTTADLAPLQEAVAKLAETTLTLQDEFGNSYALSFHDHVDWFVPGPEGWTIDEIHFISYAETDLSPKVEEDPVPATILENADGTYSFEGSARFGKNLDKSTLLANLTKALQANDSTPLVLPVTRTLPPVTVPDSLKAKGITDLVGMGYSDFSGSPVNRVHNIQVGIAQYNGILIEQGAEFSFMGQMSPVDAANGFRTELVIKGDETIPEYGGGLCQISSTMFRAALYSGLPITARRNHSYAVSYYARPFGYGLDATVYDPNPDFKFINDTPGALLVQAYTDGNSAFYVFYGTNDGRTVSMEGPYSYDYYSVAATTTYTDKLAPGEKQLKEHGHTGFKTDWYRTVTYPEGSTSTYAATMSGVRENIHSNYEARPAKYWEGQAAAQETVE